jgi:hypothetical protein
MTSLNFLWPLLEWSRTAVSLSYVSVLTMSLIMFVRCYGYLLPWREAADFAACESCKSCTCLELLSGNLEKTCIQLIGDSSASTSTDKIKYSPYFLILVEDYTSMLNMCLRWIMARDWEK